VLGSRSTDTLSGLGPPPLRAGFVLPIGRAATAPAASNRDDPGTTPADDDGTQQSLSAAPSEADAPVRLRLRMGPRHNWFNLASRDALLTGPYTMSVKSNRVGARLTGPALSRTVSGEVPSEGIVLGAVQVPTDGQPLVFLADHPTTGGYPVIGVVDRGDLANLAQTRPGATIIFETWT
jgi:allophanate hydrolase subunit 2